MSGCAGRAGRARGAFNACLQRRLRRLGEGVAARPCRAVALSLLVALACGSGLVLLRFETRVERVWVPQDADSIAQLDFLDAAFDAFPRLEQFIAEPLRDGGSAFDAAEVARVAALHEAVFALRGGTDSQLGVPPRGVCYPEWPDDPEAPCRVEGLVSLFGGDAGAMRDAARNQTSFLALLGRNREALATLAGPVEEDAAGRLRAGSVRFHYYTVPADPPGRVFLDAGSDVNDRVLAWEASYLDLANGEPRTLASAGRSIDDEIGRAVGGQSAYVAAAILLVLAFMAVLLGRPSLVHSRVLLGLSSLATVVLSELAGFGLASFFIPFSQINLLLVFVLIAIGVDDAIVLVDFWDRAPAGRGHEHRLGEALAGAGTTMLVTSATNCIAFLVSSTLDFPGVSYFCFTAAFCVVFLYVFTVTLFAALLVLDQRRQEASRADCCPCVVVRRRPPAGGGGGGGGAAAGAKDRDAGSDSEEEDRESVEEEQQQQHAQSQGNSGVFHRFFVGWWARAVVRPRVAWCVLVVAAAAMAAGAASARHLTIGIPVDDAFPSDSYLTEFWRRQEDLYDTLQGELLLAVRSRDGFNLSDGGAALDRVEEMTRAYEAHPDVIPPVRSWVRDYRSWVAATPEGAAAAAGGRPFLDAVREFLDAAPFTPAGADSAVVPRRSRRALAWTPDGRALDACLLRTYSRVDASVTGRIRQTKSQRAVMARFFPSTAAAFAWSWPMVYADRDDRLLSLVYSTLAAAAAAVLGATALFVTLRSVAMIGVCVAAVDCSLLGMMYVLEVPVDGASFVVLATAVGLSVDFVVHLAHAFDHAAGSSRDRTVTAMATVGLSVFKGGLSTLLGCSVLALSASALFRVVFFRMLVSIAGLGMLSGLVLFPALASLFGGSRDAGGGNDDAGGDAADAAAAASQEPAKLSRGAGVTSSASHLGGLDARYHLARGPSLEMGLVAGADDDDGDGAGGGTLKPRARHEV